MEVVLIPHVLSSIKRKTQADYQRSEVHACLIGSEAALRTGRFIRSVAVDPVQQV